MNFLEKLQPYKPVLWIFALVGLLGLNGTFLYYTIFQPDVQAAALENPVSVVFIVEAFLMVAFAAWVIWLMGFERPGWFLFVIMSIVGSLAFSVPFFLLMHIRKHENEQKATRTS